MTRTRLDQWRSGRNYLRPGDTARVLPTQPGRRDGYQTRIHAIYDTPTGIEIEVVHPRNGAIRIYHPDRIARRAQTRNRTPKDTE